ncbi:DNA polymerase alpha/epsilon subunit B-domain-containing protein [Rhodotorula diobovata]|uniref:DNA-directed DNA polymerase n=1 Tax=Rhodotorula diobovata TaxID=5288 RepID=A0A5C5FUA6_9BASI|nr:DNA polymerase alpha/epsilon subunit B-domain-containing protein [Rhodotorula diobovata]
MPQRIRSHFSVPDTDDPLRPSFTTSRTDGQFAKQFANLYWLRLVVQRKRVLERARKRWVEGSGLEGAKSPPQHVKRLLEVENGKLCYVVGTVYVDMPLKPNVLEDLARDHHITAPSTRRKFHSPSDEVMLEDESGRVRLVGKKIDGAEGTFVTGTIMAALGAETSSGDFDVWDYCFAGLPHQDPLVPTTTTTTTTTPGPGGEWVAIASGLEMGGADAVADVRAEMMAEWLLGEAGDEEDTKEAAQVTRLILAGNSLAQPDLSAIDDEPKKKRYGYDSTLYTAKPTETLDAFLAELVPSLPVDLMSGDKDPVEPTMPQQPLHPAMLPKAAHFEGFSARTNPFWCDIGGASFLGTSGQTVDDIFKYLDSEDRLGVAEQTLEWSHIAPTCPDTLWCYPFTDRDPFILHQAPHVYFVGNQPAFGTRLVRVAAGAGEGEGEGGKEKKVRIVLVPRFRDTGEVVLVNTATLEVKVRAFEAM